RAGAIVADTLAMIAEELSPGVSMLELDRLAEEYIRARGGVPTSKGYRGYPATLCISPNAMIVHGIPTDYRAEPGDVVSVDLGVTLDGLIADSAYTFGVGEISPDAQRLLDVCQEALGGRAGRGHARRRVVDLIGRRLALRSLRTYGCRHRGGSTGAHGGETAGPSGFATMTTRGASRVFPCPDKPR